MDDDKDIETNGGVEQPPVEMSPRMLAMQALDNARLDRMSEAGEIPPEAKPVEPKPVETDQVAAQLGAEQNAKPTTITVKVNGVESEVTLEELTRGYQKGLAADQRFQEAARERAEAERLLEEVKKIPPAVDLSPNSVQNPPNVPEDKVAEAKSFVSALFGGDEDMAVDALVKMGVMGRQEKNEPTPDLAQIVAQITPQVRQQLIVESALESFAENNEFIVANPVLAAEADKYLAQAQAEGKPFVEALQYAENQTRDYCKRMGMRIPEKPTPTTTRNAKLDRKSTIDNVRGVTAKTVVQTETEPGPSEVILEMRRARGMAA